MKELVQFKKGTLEWLEEEISFNFQSTKAKKTLATAKACNKLAKSLTEGDFENGRQDDLLKKLHKMSVRLERDEDASPIVSYNINKLIKILDEFDY